MTAMSSTETSDSGMYKMMGLLVIALSVITIVTMILARIIGADQFDPTDKVMRNALVERIAPVGQVRTAEMAAAEGEAAAAAPEPVVLADSGKSGEEIYGNACAACHAAGVAGAPKFGDDEAWAERNALGLEALVASVINGKGAMPPRAGTTDVSDGDLERAVKHLTGL